MLLNFLLIEKKKRKRKVYTTRPKKKRSLVLKMTIIRTTDTATIVATGTGIEKTIEGIETGTEITREMKGKIETDIVSGEIEIVKEGTEIAREGVTMSQDLKMSPALQSEYYC